MIYNTNGSNEIILDPIIIGNDDQFYDDYGLELINQGDNLSLVLPQDSDFIWLNDNFTVYDLETNAPSEIFDSQGLTDNSKELTFIINQDMGATQYEIRNLSVIANSPNISANVRLKNNSTDDFIGYNSKSIDCGLPTVSIDENYSIWLNQNSEKSLPDLQINESDITVLESGFSLGFSDNGSMRSSLIELNQESLDNIEIWFNGQNKTNLFNIIYEPFNQVFEMELIQGEFINYPVIIKNLPFRILSNTYDLNDINQLANQSVILSFSEFDSDFVNSNSNSISVSPSLFFTKPRIYSIDDQPKISFYVKNNFFPNLIADDLSQLVSLNINGQNIGGNIDSFNTSDCNPCADYLSSYDNLSTWSYNIPDSMIHLINIEYDKLQLEEKIDTLQLKLNLDSSKVTFTGLNPNDINYLSPRKLNQINYEQSIITICFTCIQNNYDIDISLENMNTGEINQMIDWNISEGYYLETSSLETLESDLYFMRMQRIDSDTNSINIEKVIQLDNINPSIYSSIYSEDFSINPLPGSNSVGLGHDITRFDDIRFTVIDGPSYFGNTFVIHNSTNNISNYDLNYLYNNNLNISFDVNLNNQSVLLPIDLDNIISINDDFSYAYEFDNLEWLDLTNDSYGPLVYTLDISDNSGNEYQQSFEFYLQATNEAALMNFLIIPIHLIPKIKNIHIFVIHYYPLKNRVN